MERTKFEIIMANLNLDEILALFENGERRYAEDPIFKSVANSLKMGLGVYAVLDHTLKEHSLLTAKFKALNCNHKALQNERDLLNDFANSITILKPLK
jgi:hypothetical protein